ncbi:hypothetical protein [Hydrogenophaga sp. 5NK40-0174]|uniref:hypothetical protein n=1 Tax=Hydrogenophaga sp. 5NK40-0174 TaxID=3127649 RepID=UPI00310996A8
MNAPVRVLKAIVLSAAVVALAACGDGGDDGDSGKTHSFAGKYNLSMSKTTDTCGITQSALVGQQTVEQNGEEITVREDGLNMVGKVSAEGNGFDALGQMVESGVLIDTTMRYVTTDTKGKYSTMLKLVANYKGVSCEVIYQGTATRL